MNSSENPAVFYENDFVFNIEEFDEEELENFAEIGATFSPSDYYFKVFDQPDNDTPLWATITPKKYYDDNGCPFDGHITQEAGGLLALHPDYSELAEGDVEAQDPAATATSMEADLLKRGFIHNPNL